MSPDPVQRRPQSEQDVGGGRWPARPGQLPGHAVDVRTDRSGRTRLQAGGEQ
jgi:hypothetical protein